ncbi:hypothetical protein GCM10009661_34320 [Catellatospora chokoriensis]|uniref:Uncharacterized protein n=1 Tax=Catellatospora chokoriensis TaxID=310353 RepID=A0A8J3JN73_9ACTN|nr:hypothetical protein Cch02nite_14210 [Catellatospora chokoriensis]
MTADLSAGVSVPLLQPVATRAMETMAPASVAAAFIDRVFMTAPLRGEWIVAEVFAVQSPDPGARE